VLSELSKFHIARQVKSAKTFPDTSLVHRHITLDSILLSTLPTTGANRSFSHQLAEAKPVNVNISFRATKGTQQIKEFKLLPSTRQLLAQRGRSLHAPMAGEIIRT